MSTQLSDFAANQPKPGYVAVLMMRCPKCGAEQEDHDGFGVLFCPKCGYCTHASVNGNVCGLCGHQVALGGLPESESLADKLARLEAENKQLKIRAEEAEDRWHRALLKLGRPEQRNTQEVLVSLANLAEETLGVQQHILKQLQTAAESRNVVEIDSNGSAGKIKVKVRCTGETLEDAHMTALEQFAQAMAEVEAGAVNEWAQTVEMLAAKKDAA